MSICVNYIYSACVVVKTPDVAILTDPWFTDGAYDGSWFQFPKTVDPFKTIGNVDIIYVSHIHPDHYDPTFLKQYFEKFGVKRIIIAEHTPNYLAGKMKADGIDFEIVKEDDKISIGSTRLEVMPHKTGSISDIDSALIVEYEDSGRRHCIVNANDIIFDEKTRKQLKAKAKEVDILLCGYTGAGPYPQTFFETDDPQLIIEADKKKVSFFGRYTALIAEINAKVNIPFAGKYLLGGTLSNLNAFRGVADAVEVLDIDERAVVLMDDGGKIDTADLIPEGVRTEPYSKDLINQRIKEISNSLMEYEKFINPNEIHQIPIKRLLASAVRNAIKKSEVEGDYYFTFPVSDNEYALINANKQGADFFKIIDKSAELPMPRSEIDIDIRYLYGLLTHVYHWNSNEVGSHSRVRRTPNEFNRSAQNFLNFLTL